MNSIKKILDYVPLFTVCLIYFGFCNLHYYYDEFNIDINNYINNTEIILAFFPNIVVILSFIFGVLSQYYTQLSFEKKQELIKTNISIIMPEYGKPKRNLTQKKSKFYNNFFFPFIIFLILQLIIFTIKYVFKNEYHFKDYEFQYFNLISSVINYGIIYYLLIRNEKLEHIKKFPFIITLFIILFIGRLIAEFRISDAQRVKNGISKKNIIFKDKESIITTNKDLVFVGQTQNFLILYNTKNKTAEIFKTSQIDKITVF